MVDRSASVRTLRLADGPDEVHWFVVGRAEVNNHVPLDWVPGEEIMHSQVFSGP